MKIYLVLRFPKGKSINIVWTGKNYGMGVTARDSWYDRVYLSRDDKQGSYLPDNIYIITYVIKTSRILNF